MEKRKILYAEDDETIAFLLRDALSQEYEIQYCANGEEALQQFENEMFDLCLFDIMMPKMNGFDLATEIRKRNQEIPILFLSAKTLKEDRIKGLKIGADDYLVKPFSIEELQLKIEIFLKRTQKSHSEKPSQFQLGNYFFDVKNYKLSAAEKEIKLTQREAELLNFLIQNKNKVLKREEILLAVWGNDDYFLGRSLDVFISRLRKKLAEVPQVSIENLHGIGFKFLVE